MYCVYVWPSLCMYVYVYVHVFVCLSVCTECAVISHTLLDYTTDEALHFAVLPENGKTCASIHLGKQLLCVQKPMLFTSYLLLKICMRR